MAQLLWRIEGACEEPNRAGWEKGVTLHLLFQSLTLVLARRDELTRRYLALEGCPRFLAEEWVHPLSIRRRWQRIEQVTFPPAGRAGEQALPTVTLGDDVLWMPQPGEQTA